MNDPKGSIESQVEYGLESVNGDRTIELNLKDFLYLHNTIAELVRFFHQPMHYPELSDVEKFLGNKDDGMYRVLSKCLYEKFSYRNVFPADLVEMMEEGKFENPESPFYFRSE